MKKLRFAIVALIIGAAPAAEAQYTYDWSTGARTEETRLQAGRRNEIVVTGLNTLCYTPQVRLTTTDAKVDFGGFVGSLSVTAEPTPGTKQAPPAPDPSDSFLDASVDEAERYSSAAEWRINAVREAIDVVAEFADTLAHPPCERGRAWSLPAFQTRWDAQRLELERDLNRAGTWLGEAESYLNSADSLLKRIERASSPAAADYRQAAAERTRQELVEERAATHAALPGAISRFLSVDADMAALRFGQTVRNQTRFGHDVERVQLVVAMTPIADSDAPVVPADTIEEGVLRRFRLFVSTGAFMSLMRQRDFERTNRPFLRDSTTASGGTVGVPTDSTYSTYANRRSGMGDLVSPTVQLNAVLTDIPYLGSGVPFMFSFGAAARSVGGTLLPEPFFGFSVGVNDRIVFGSGVHFGRNETLLLMQPGESPDDVARRRVPETVTPSDAIGVGWERARYFTISVRL